MPISKIKMQEKSAYQGFALNKIKEDKTNFSSSGIDIGLQKSYCGIPMALLLVTLFYQCFSSSFPTMYSYFLDCVTLLRRWKRECCLQKQM